jgi:hypothetical protein
MTKGKLISNISYFLFSNIHLGMTGLRKPTNGLFGRYSCYPTNQPSSTHKSLLLALTPLQWEETSIQACISTTEKRLSAHHITGIAEYYDLPTISLRNLALYHVLENPQLDRDMFHRLPPFQPDSEADLRHVCPLLSPSGSLTSSDDGVR